MNGVGSVRELEKETDKDSPLHSMDGRVKLILLIFIIVYAVFSTQIMVMLFLEIYLLILIYISNVSFKTSLTRILLLLPFGGFIILFQPFIHPGNVIWSGAFGIHITDGGLMWAALLMSRLIVALTSIVLLSSISPMQEVVESFRKLGMPREFAMILSLMIRFLFMFYDELHRITHAQKARCFDAFNKKLPYKWRMKQMGYTVAMMFLRAYEQGETIYLSMASRGFSDKSKLYHDRKKKIGSGDYAFIASTLGLVACLQILAMSFFYQWGFLGMNIV
ncbi:cobalt ECF transporter T component CbiQ [Methanobacterium formicicum]|uniref:Cobalt ABC transporter inner membrane subunit CbiQ n=1 Tax=Methanobacterium formicicum (strain DSM 3637 / PP1) TaxID=1204725 RepID=K2R305_METFP|nr:cobalt ECF transporter T component CbiQ [Methanobacterium formicicum]EKF85617.1 cobalt ABC transporter inner membrane subunit CbiQ [Methanobacterium formicicum DSM 3637]